jgi:hypothetical protein
MRIFSCPTHTTGLSTTKPSKRNAMQFPHINAAEGLVLGYLGKITFDNAVAAMPKPSKSTGFYFWLYGFTTGEKIAVDGYLDSRFHIPAAQPTTPITAADAAKEGK